MKTKNIDYPLFFVVFSLVVFGMIMISSVSVYPSFKVVSLLPKDSMFVKYFPNAFYFFKSLTHTFISILLFILAAKTPYKFFEKYAKYIFGATLMFLFIVLIIGVTYNGAKGWINIPFMPFSLQPAEFLKLGVVIYLAYFLKRKKSDISDFKNGFMPFIFIIGIIIVLLGLQPDFGTILIVVPISVILFFIGGGNIKHLGVIFLSGILFAGTIYSMGKVVSGGSRNTFSYITERFDNFMSDNQTSIQNKTINFQTEQGLIAIGSGGYFGLGFGKSIQKFGYLPEVQGDFIFSVIAEELGFFGVLILVLLYLFIAYRGFFISSNVTDPFGKYLAAGITTWIIVQAFINMGVNLNIVPLTGITLPFVSYGGSSLMSLMIGIGILLNVSRDVNFETMKHSNSKFFQRKKVMF
ncbi:MAG: putative peptidoglycan glycosyltransferase FtsW [Candidatus Gracilibacteria bacterium]|nr:putative peptidoglycan glycosyltransferase FtsW [Candidatus Gracilibacteria bacterium]